jgi:hypothetical protein
MKDEKRHRITKDNKQDRILKDDKQYRRSGRVQCTTGDMYPPPTCILLLHVFFLLI